MKFPHQSLLFLVVGSSSASTNHQRNLRRVQVTSHPCQSFFTESVFNAIAPHATLPYSYGGFCNAVTDWNAANPNDKIFMGGTESDQRDELAAFFGNTLHESDEFRATREYAQCQVTTTDSNGKVYCKPPGYNGGDFTNHYCSSSHTSTSDPDGCDCLAQVPESSSQPGYVEADLLFFGRGVMQLSWNYNYIDAGAAIGVDLCANPDLVASNAEYTWMSAFWFWTMNTGAVGKTCAQAVTEGSFGGTLQTINGGLECPAVGGHYGSVTSRLNDYCRASTVLGVGSLLDFTGCDGLQSQFDDCRANGWCPSCSVWGPTPAPTPPQPTQSPTTAAPTTPNPTNEPTTAAPTPEPTPQPTPDPNVFFINWDVDGGKCVKNCLTGDAGCSPNRYATPWENTFSDVQACCAQLWVGCPDQQIPCPACTDADISAWPQVTSQPTKAPTTASPTTSQPTASPTKTAPTTPSPTNEPTTAAPSPEPTPAPTPDPNTFYINWDTENGKCVQNCVSGEAPCTSRLSYSWETTYADVQACCAQLSGKCPDPNIPCPACTDADISSYVTTTTTQATTTTTPDSSTFYVSYDVDATGKCVQNCNGDPPCGGINGDSWVRQHTDVQECCQKALSWKCPDPAIPCEACTDADISAWTTTSTTTTTQATTTTQRTDATAPPDLDKFYVSYDEDATGKCVGNFGDHHNSDAWVKKFDNVVECCSRGLPWKCPGDTPCPSCTDVDISAYTTTTTVPPPQGIFYIDWNVSKCVEDCNTGEPQCGGPPTYQKHHATLASCCEEHLSYKCQGSYPCSACTDVPFDSEARKF